MPSHASSASPPSAAIFPRATAFAKGGPPKDHSSLRTCIKGLGFVLSGLILKNSRGFTIFMRSRGWSGDGYVIHSCL